MVLVWRWRQRFTRDSLTPLAELLCDARPMKYSRILEMGARLQAQEHHPYALNAPSRAAAHVCSVGSYTEAEFHNVLHPIVSVWWKQLGTHGHGCNQTFFLTTKPSIAIQRLHRNWFARAIIENPTNPYESIYAPSFLATFHSTRILLKLTIRSYDTSNLVLRRLHNIWSNVVVCGVCLVLL